MPRRRRPAAPRPNTWASAVVPSEPTGGISALRGVTNPTYRDHDDDFRRACEASRMMYHAEILDAEALAEAIQASNNDSAEVCTPKAAAEITAVVECRVDGSGGEADHRAMSAAFPIGASGVQVPLASSSGRSGALVPTAQTADPVGALCCAHAAGVASLMEQGVPASRPADDVVAEAVELSLVAHKEEQRLAALEVEHLDAAILESLVTHRGAWQRRTLEELRQEQKQVQDVGAPALRSSSAAHRTTEHSIAEPDDGCEGEGAKVSFADEPADDLDKWWFADASPVDRAIHGDMVQTSVAVSPSSSTKVPELEECDQDKLEPVMTDGSAFEIQAMQDGWLIVHAPSASRGN